MHCMPFITFQYLQSMKKSLFLFLSLYLAIGCAERSAYSDAVSFDYSDFANTKELKDRELLSYYISENPSQIRIVDSLLLVTNSGTEKLIQVFNRNEKSYSGSFLQLGRAANEVLTAPRYIDYSSRLNKLWVHDKMTSRILAYDLGQVNDPENLVPVFSITTKDLLDNIILLSSEKLIATPWNLFNVDYRIGIADFSGNLISSFGEFPDSPSSGFGFGLPEVFSSRIVVNEDESKVMLFGRNTDRIELYDTEGTLLKALHGPDHFSPIFGAESNDRMSRIITLDGQTRCAYYDPVVAGDGYIWVSYSGSFIEDNDRSIKRIMVFDWEMNPVALYHFPHHIVSFDVDTEQQTIYILALDEDLEYRLYLYRYN